MATTPTPITSLSVLPPELIDLIVLYLHSSDLAHCTLTNREWHRIFAPHLWRSVKIVLPTHLCSLPFPSGSLRRLPKFKASIASGCLVEKGHLVETLHLGYYEVLELLDSSYHSGGCGEGGKGEAVETGLETVKQPTDDDNDGNDNDNDSDKTDSDKTDSDKTDSDKTDSDKTDSDKTDSDKKYSGEQPSTTREFKSMCTNLGSIHIGSGLDPTHKCFISTEPVPYYPTPGVSFPAPPASGNAFTFGSSGFGANTTSGFGANTYGFGANTSGFGANTYAFGANTSGFDASTSGFGANTSGFGVNTSGVGPETSASSSTSTFANTTSVFGSATSGLGTTSAFGNTSAFGAQTADETTPFGARATPTISSNNDNISSLFGDPPTNFNAWRFNPIYPQRHPLIDHPLDLSFLVSLLRQNNQLRKLSLQGRLLDFYGGVVGDLADVFNVLPAGLMSLRLNGFRGSTLNIRDRLTFEERKKIEQKEPPSRPRWSPPLPLFPPQPQILHALRKIRILNSRISDSLLVSLFERSPNLQSLRIVAAQEHIIHADISTALYKSCPRLNELVLSGDLGTDKDLARMINASSGGWVTLAIPTFSPYPFDLSRPRYQELRSPFGPFSADALLDHRHMSTLENLFMDKCKGFACEDIHQLLCSAPRLRRLMLMSASSPSGRDACLHARDLIRDDEQWVCRSLEEFSCQIIGVPRPDRRLSLTATQTSYFQSNMDASHAVHRKIYTRFAQLPQLKELVLGKGKSNVSSLFSGSYLSMSLESGLEILAGLKELHTVDCDMLKTQFWTENVQQWARNNWPRYGKGEAEGVFWHRTGCWDTSISSLGDPLADYM